MALDNHLQTYILFCFWSPVRSRPPQAPRGRNNFSNIWESKAIPISWNSFYTWHLKQNTASISFSPIVFLFQLFFPLSYVQMLSFFNTQNLTLIFSNFTLSKWSCLVLWFNVFYILVIFGKEEPSSPPVFFILPLQPHSQPFSHHVRVFPPHQRQFHNICWMS